MSDRIPLAGESRRDRPTMDVRGLPLSGRVAVTPVRLERGWTFEVRAEWLGPPAPDSGFPPVDGPVQGNATHYEAELERAERIAKMAVDELRELRVPDFRALVAR